MSMSMSASKALSVSRIFSSTDFVDEVGVRSLFAVDAVLPCLYLYHVVACVSCSIYEGPALFCTAIFSCVVAHLCACMCVGIRSAKVEQ